MDGHEPEPREADDRPRFKIEPDDTLAAAAACVIGKNEKRLRKHARRLAETDDPEEVHDARVAARRIRSAFDVFDDELGARQVKELRRALRRAGRVLGTVRDLDVLLALVTAEGDDGLVGLAEDLRAERASALDDLRREMATRRFGRSIRDLRDFALDRLDDERGTGDERRGLNPAVTARSGAASRILGAYEQVAAFRVDPLTADVETLHRLRIAGKRLRYAIEAFLDVLPSEAEGVRDEVVALQDDAGKLHDDVVAARRARMFVAQQMQAASDARGGAPDAAVAIERFALSRDQDVERLRHTLADRLARVNSREFRARLCEVIVV